MTKRLAWIATLAAALAAIAVVVLRTTTPDARRSDAVDPPVRNVSLPPRATPPARRHAPDVDAAGSPERTPAPRRLWGGKVVHGKLVFAATEHPSLARVALVPIDDSETPPDATRLLLAENAYWLDGKTEFDLRARGPGRYLLGVVFRDGTIGATSTVDLTGDDEVEQDLRVPAMDVHEDVLVRVVDPDGHVSAGADVQAGFSIGFGHDDLDAVVHTDDDGTVRVGHDAPDAPRSALAGSERIFHRAVDRAGTLTHFVEAATVNFARRRVVYDPQRDREVTIRFTAPALLTVTVEGLTTNPDCDRLRLVLVPKSGGQEVGQTYVRDGRFEFDPADPGDYELRLELARRDEPGVLLSSQTLTLTDGPRAVSVGIAKLFALTVTSPAGVRLDPSSFVLIRVVGARRERVTSPATVEGASVMFRSLRGGTYCVSSWSKDASGEMTFEVNDDRTVDWQPAAPNALRLELDGRHEGGGIDCRFPERLSGALIVALDGVDCSSGDEPLVDRLDRAALKRWVEVEILREGGREKADLTSVSPYLLRPATR